MARLINCVSLKGILATLLIAGVCSCSSVPAEPPVSADTATELTNQQASEGQQAQPLTEAQRQSQQAAIVAITERRYADAVAVLQHLPDSQSQYMAAVCWYRLQHFEHANASLTTLLSAQPNHAPALNLRGLIAQHQGLFRQAERDFLSAVAATPSFAPAERNLGILYELYLANPSQAALHYQRYVALTGDKTVQLWQQALTQTPSQAPATDTPANPSTEQSTEQRSEPTTEAQ